jgi:CRP-like cAMP-binding protein
MLISKQTELISGSTTVLAPGAASGRLMWDALLVDCRRIAKAVKFRKGGDVIVAGSCPQLLFVNHDGWLFRYKILHDGRRQIVNFVLPGEIFGLEAYVFKKSLYSVATITESLLTTVPTAMVDKAIEQNAKVSKALFLSAMGEVAILSEHLIDTARRSAYARVGHFLLELFVRLEQAGQIENASFHMPLTQELMGDALGLTAVHVNRTLRLLRDEKLITLEGKRVTLCDLDALCRLCDFEDCYLSEMVAAHRNRMAPSAFDVFPGKIGGRVISRQECGSTVTS